MPRPRTPLTKARLTGATAHNPQRFRDRTDIPGGPAGDPPKFLSAAEKASWKEFCKEWSWLTNQDRPALASLCQMRALIEDAKVEKTASMYNTYRLMLSDFGGTPVSRSKVSQPVEDDSDDPFAEFDC